MALHQAFANQRHAVRPVRRFWACHKVVSVLVALAVLVNA